MCWCSSLAAVFAFASADLAGVEPGLTQ